MYKLAILCIVGLAFASAVQAATGKHAADSKAMLAHGRHLAMIAGCNDCHTAGYMDKNGEVPQSQWLMGNPMGWHGPWGTTFPVNLRLVAKDLTEKQWITRLRTVKPRPPMPAYIFKSMSDYDLASIYQFIRSLGSAGAPAPTDLPPGQKPTPPYFDVVLPAAPPAKLEP